VIYAAGPCPGGPENGLPLDEMDSRRPGRGGPAHETGLDEVDTGDCIVDPKRAGLPVTVEKVAEVGVVGALDCVSYSTGPGLPIMGGSYAFIVLSDKRALALAPPSLAMARGGGLRRISGDCATLIVEAVEMMLEAERFLLWPLL
jgi:hypothetical protein